MMALVPLLSAFFLSLDFPFQSPSVAAQRLPSQSFRSVEDSDREPSGAQAMPSGACSGKGGSMSGLLKIL
jgi:hypothetical protein